jgi:outer membrane protein assembly factor BamB
MYRGNLQNTGEYDTRAACQFADANWEFTAKGPIKCSPVVHDGIVYFTAHDDCLYAVESKDGVLKWMTRIERATEWNVEIGVSPAVGGRYVWYVDDKFNLHAVDKQSLSSEIHLGSELEVLHTPRVFNEAVYIGGTQYFAAVDTMTNAVRWFVDCGGSFFVAPVISEGVVYFIDKYGVIFSVDAETGREKGRWIIETDETGVGIGSEVVFADGIIYFLDTYEEYFPDECNDLAEDDLPYLRAVSLETRKTIWRVKHGCLLASPALDREKVYVCSYEGQLKAFDKTNGSIKWVFEANSPVKSAPSIAENLIYFGTLGGTLFVVDTATGSEIARYETQDKQAIRTSPALADGVVYFGDDGGKLYSWGAPGE